MGFSLRTVENWNKSPREVAEAPAFEIFKTRLDTVLGNLLWLTLLEQRD